MRRLGATVGVISKVGDDELGQGLIGHLIELGIDTSHIGKVAGQLTSVSLAWADGRVDEEEIEVVNALLDAFGASDEEAEEIRAWAKQPRTLEEVEIGDLTVSDTELALQHAVLLTYIDGEQSKQEVELIGKFVAKLGFSDDVAAPILASADAWAKSLLPELES